MCKEPEQRLVTVELDGNTYRATYTVDSGPVTLVWCTTDGARRLGSTYCTGKGEYEARMLLREILAAMKERGEL